MADATGTQVPITVIKPNSGWRRLGLHELWSYRELLWFLTTRDLKSRYRQMALGPLWIILKPFIGMIVFSVIFGGFAKLPSQGLPYPIFSLAALIPWVYFFEAARTSSSSLADQVQVISKVYFPRMLLPISASLSTLADFFVSFALLGALMIYYGIAPSVNIIALPFFVALCFAVSLTIGFWLATLTVRFRDVRFIVLYALQGWMYLTPVVYSAEMVPERWLTLYKLNPMFWVVEGIRWSVLGRGYLPEPLMFVSIGAVLILLLAGAFVFRRTERTIVDLL